jgi:hypothetical protein
MYKDARIAVTAMQWARWYGAPLLPVHDSFIVRAQSVATPGAPPMARFLANCDYNKTTRTRDVRDAALPKLRESLADENVP